MRLFTPVLPLCLCLMAVVVGAQGPEPNYQGSAAIINSTLYYFGGRNSTYSGFSSLFSLSLASSFSNTTNLEPWRSRASLPYGISECASWVWNGKLWQEGGIVGEPQIVGSGIELSPLQNDVLMYDPATDVWSAPLLPKSPVIQRRLHAAVVNETKGIVYFVGGTSDIYTGTTTCNNGTGQQCLQAQPYALDLNQLLWVSLSSDGAPMVWKHAMALINAVIYVIGGDGVTLDSIPTYDTIGNKWSQVVPVGQSPPPRAGCTAVVHPDNVTIVMYGGWDRLTNPSIAVPLSDLWAFNTETQVWKQIPDSGATPVTYPASVIVNDQMFVMFGSTQNNVTLEGTRTFFFINVTNGQVLTDYQPPTTISTSPSTTSTATQSQSSDGGGQSNSELIIASVLASAAIVALFFALLAVFFFLRRRRLGPPQPPPHVIASISDPGTAQSTLNDSDTDFIARQKPNEMANYKPDQGSSMRQNRDGMRYNQGSSMRQNQDDMRYNQGSSMRQNQDDMRYNQGSSMRQNQDGMRYNQGSSMSPYQSNISLSQSNISLSQSKMSPYRSLGPYSPGNF